MRIQCHEMHQVRVKFRANRTRGNPHGHTVIANTEWCLLVVFISVKSKLFCIEGLCNLSMWARFWLGIAISLRCKQKYAPVITVLAHSEMCCRPLALVQWHTPAVLTPSCQILHLHPHQMNNTGNVSPSILQPQPFYIYSNSLQITN